MNVENKKKPHSSGDWEIPAPEYDYCGPYGKDSIDYTHRVIINNRYFQIFIALLVLILVFLSVGYFRLSNNLTAIVKMPDYGEIKVGRMQSDPLYFRVWGDYILGYIANFTPSDIKGHIEKSLVVFDRDILIEKKPEFEHYYQSIKTNRITQNFRFNDSEVDIKLENSGGGATIVYKGVATQKISDLAARKKLCSYEMHFLINNGEIVQDSLKTDCLDDKTITTKTAEESIEDAKNGNKKFDLKPKESETIQRIEKPMPEKDGEEETKPTPTTEKGKNNPEDYKIKIDENYIMQDLKSPPSIPVKDAKTPQAEDKTAKVDNSSKTNKEAENPVQKEVENPPKKTYNDENTMKRELEKKLNTKESATYE